MHGYLLTHGGAYNARVASEQAHPQVIPDPPAPVDWKEAARLYVAEGLSCSVIARRMGHHYHSIRRALLKHGIPKHKPEPGRGRHF